jgi:hypothetical protein
VLIIVPELHTNFSVRIKLLFTWIFDSASLKSVVFLIIANIAFALLTLNTAKKRELVSDATY